MKQYWQDVDRILVSEEQIQQTVTRIAKQIDEDYKDKDLIILCILKGSVVFFSDLLRKITVPAEMDFMRVSSYGAGTKTSGNIRILLDIDHSRLKTSEILIIEDIIDSGRTLSYLCEYLKLRGAKSVRTCTLLDKPDRREVEFVPDYVGIVIPDEFVVGYGLDYDEKYRTLPYVGVLKEEIYKNKE